MSKKFKVGDKVIIAGCTCGGNDCSNGKTAVISEVSANGMNHLEGLGEWNNKNLKLLETNKNNMNIKDKFVEMFLKEPEKSFRKAGITNGDGFITEEGQTILLTWLLNKNGDAFKTEVVDGLLAEDKDSE